MILWSARSTRSEASDARADRAARRWRPARRPACRARTRHGCASRASRTECREGIVVARLMRHRDVEAHAVVQEGVRDVPVIIAEIPARVLAQTESRSPPRTAAPRPRNAYSRAVRRALGAVIGRGGATWTCKASSSPARGGSDKAVRQRLNRVSATRFGPGPARPRYCAGTGACRPARNALGESPGGEPAQACGPAPAPQAGRAQVLVQDRHIGAAGTSGPTTSRGPSTG